MVRSKGYLLTLRTRHCDVLCLALGQNNRILNSQRYGIRQSTFGSNSNGNCAFREALDLIGVAVAIDDLCYRVIAERHRICFIGITRVKRHIQPTSIVHRQAAEVALQINTAGYRRFLYAYTAGITVFVGVNSHQVRNASRQENCEINFTTVRIGVLIAVHCVAGRILQRDTHALTAGNEAITAAILRGEYEVMGFPFSQFHIHRSAQLHGRHGIRGQLSRYISAGVVIQSDCIFHAASERITAAVSTAGQTPGPVSIRVKHRKIKIFRICKGIVSIGFRCEGVDLQGFTRRRHIHRPALLQRRRLFDGNSSGIAYTAVGCDSQRSLAHLRKVQVDIVTAIAPLQLTIGIDGPAAEVKGQVGIKLRINMHITAHSALNGRQVYRTGRCTGTDLYSYLPGGSCIAQGQGIRLIRVQIEICISSAIGIDIPYGTVAAAVAGKPDSHIFRAHVHHIEASPCSGELVRSGIVFADLTDVAFAQGQDHRLLYLDAVAGL